MNELKEQLISTVGEKVKSLGFKYVKREYGFVKRRPDGRETLHLAFIRHPSDFHVVADVAIRFDALEELCFVPHPLLSENDKAKTYSFGAELGNIAGVGQKRWELATIEDIEPIAEGIYADFISIGVPFLERLSTLEKAFDLVNRPWREASLFQSFHTARAKHVIGLAKLLGKDDELAGLARAQLEMLESVDGRNLPQFTEFLAKLGIEV